MGVVDARVLGVFQQLEAPAPGVGDVGDQRCGDALLRLGANLSTDLPDQFHRGADIGNGDAHVVENIDRTVARHAFVGHGAHEAVVMSDAGPGTDLARFPAQHPVVPLRGRFLLSLGTR